MHELSIAQNIIEIVKENAGRLKAARVTEVAVDIGAVSGVVPEALLFAWEMTVKDTLAEASLLKINIIEPKAVCRKCGKEFEMNANFLCTYCNSSEYKVILGRELKVRSIKVE